MAASELALNAALDAIGDIAAFASLHTNDPGSTGMAEVIGGDYERQPIEWQDADGGSKVSANSPVFGVPVGTYAYYGLWTADGDWVDGGRLANIETFAGSGNYTIGTVTLTLDGV